MITPLEQFAEWDIFDFPEKGIMALHNVTILATNTLQRAQALGKFFHKQEVNSIRFDLGTLWL